MRQRLIFLLKHDAFIQKLYRLIVGTILRICGLFVGIDENTVLFVSFMGKGFNDSPKRIYDYMQKNSAYKAYRCVWAFEQPEKHPELTTVKIDSFRYFKTALGAKYWITNTNIERGLTFKKKSQVYLNTWHGIALKHIGNDCPGRSDYHFGTVDHLVVSGDYDEKVWKSAFCADEKTYLRCGMPRNDELWVADESHKIAARKKLGIAEDQTVILYAPTWRDSEDGGLSYKISPPIHFEKWKNVLGENYVVLFRAHHQTTKVLGIAFNEFVRDVSEYADVNELMIASDLLVTDYSAIAFDYAILCRPIFCYAYDYDTYLAQRGTYFEIDERYPNKSCRTEEELLRKIKEMDYQTECKNTQRFKDAFIQYGPGATQACVSAVFGE